MPDHSEDFVDRIEAAVESGNRFRRDDVISMLREVKRSRLLLDDGLTFKELEAKIRDGALTVHAVGSDEQGAPALRFLAALLLHILLGENASLPPNYQAVEWSIKPAGETEPVRVCAEIVKPGGKSSHEIRRDLEARLSGSSEVPDGD